MLWKGKCTSKSDYCVYVPTDPTCPLTTAPTPADVDPPTITSVQLVNGGTQDKYDAGDKIVISFSEPIDPISINQNLFPNGEVTGVVLASQTGALIVRSQVLTLADGYQITGTTTLITVRNILDPIIVSAYGLDSSWVRTGYTLYPITANVTLNLSTDAKILTITSTNVPTVPPYYNPTVRNAWVGTTTVVAGTVKDTSGNAIKSAMLYNIYPPQLSGKW